jgi:hypothetical protein
MFVRGVFYQWMEITLFKSLYSGDPLVIANPHCIVLIKALDATFELALLLVKPLRAIVIP